MDCFWLRIFWWDAYLEKNTKIDEILGYGYNLGDLTKAKKYPIVTKVEKDVNLNSVMSNSFGFGGTNATLVFEKVK